MATLTIDWSSPRQRIDGFGVHGAFRQAANLRLYPEADQRRVLDILFSTEGDGAGLSIIRNIIGDSGSWGVATNGPTPSIWPEPGVVNYDGDEDQIWFMRQARDRGCTTFVSTAWSPPAWMKSNGDVAHGGNLAREHYRDFAEYLAEYVKIYRDQHGIEIFAISPANEPDFTPDYSSCAWTGAQFAEFYREHLGPVWERECLGALIFGPELVRFSDAALEDYRDFLLDRESARYLDIVALHGYENLEVARLDSRFVGDRRVWMSELGIIGSRHYKLDPSMSDGLEVAQRVHDYLTVAQVNAFIYFWGISCLTDHNAALVELDLETFTWRPAKRAFTLGNFSRFVRPGSRRFEASIDGSVSVAASAYRDPEGRAVIVLVNRSESAVSLRVDSRHAQLGQVDHYVTDVSHNLVVVPPTGGAELDLPARSVTTLREARVERPG